MTSVKEQMEAMLAGTHVNEVTVEEEKTTETIEDTDQNTETEFEQGTESIDDDQTKDTKEDDVEDEEENTQENITDNSTTEEEETTEETVETTPAEEINYKEFYEKVALAKFTANGKEVEGFKNPEDLIRAQQMLHGYSDKMKVLKEYKKFIKPLEERKITADPEKFNLAMSILDGDVEAIKKVIKEKNIDPLEMDLENIKYSSKNVIPSDAQLIIEDYAEQAKEMGLEDKFYNVLTKDFDKESLNEFIKDGAVRSDLMKHLANGAYDVVKQEIRKMELLDADGSLEGYSTVDKYRMAVKRLNEAHAKTQPKQNVPVQKVVKVDSEKDRLKKEQAEVEFKRKAAEKEKEVDEQRKKAASVSKTKPIKKIAEKEVKPEALKGEDFRNYFKQMMMN